MSSTLSGNSLTNGAMENGGRTKSKKKRRGMPWTKIFLFVLFLEVACFFVFLIYFQVNHEKLHKNAPNLGVPRPNEKRSIEKEREYFGMKLRRNEGIEADNTTIEKSRLFRAGKNVLPPRPKKKAAKEKAVKEAAAPPVVYEKIHVESSKGKLTESSPRTDEDLPANMELKRLESKVAEQIHLSGRTLRSCRWYRRARLEDDSTIIEMDYCNNGKQLEGLLSYNALNVSRILCGTSMEPQRVVQLPKLCAEVPRLFPKDPTVSGEGMPPIQVSAGGRHKISPFECSVPCEVEPLLGGGPSLSRHVEGTNWYFQFSMEGSHYYPNLRVSKNGYKEDNYYATTSFESEIPLPYYSKAEYTIQQPAVDFDKGIKGASFLARNCNSYNDRETMVKNLQKFFRVDSLSACLHNAEPPNGLSLKDKSKLQQQYLFHLAFENGCVDDYITEKLWGTLGSGTLPVYYGAPNVKEHAPPNSIIVVQDFKTPKDLGDYLNKVASNKTLYDSYHAWRTKELPESFYRKLGFTDVHSNCRICRWAYAKKYGFGWNHTIQDLYDTAIPRKVSIHDGLIQNPFQEKWIDTKTQEPLAVSPVFSKSTFSEVGAATIGSTGVTRTVYEHDGVLDLVITSTEEIDHFALQLQTVMKKATFSPSEMNPRRFRLQDDRTRFTIVTSWDANVSRLPSGIVQIAFGKSLPLQANLRLRVIVESLDKFHRGGELAKYYFGDLMTQDLLNPIETFYVS